MIYTTYPIKVITPYSEPEKTKINWLFLLILCYLADGFGADKITEKLKEHYAIDRKQRTIEDYIKKMKEVFIVRERETDEPRTAEELVSSVKEMRIIAERDRRHEIIIEDTLAESIIPKLFDIERPRMYIVYAPD